MIIKKKTKAASKNNSNKHKRREVIFRADSKQTNALIKAGHAGAAKAIRAAKALGLSITYMENGILYKEHADNTKEVIAKKSSKKKSIKKAGIQFKKGMVFHARY